MAEKKKGVVDFVFLVDGTGSMGKCMDALKGSLNAFLAELTSTQSIIQDWRGKLVTFRDEAADGSLWFEDNPFVRDTAALAAQVATLTPKGGGDEPESLLDALHKVVTAEATPKNMQEDDPTKWRSGITRCVVAFTDATCHPTMTYAGAAGGSATDVINALHASKMNLIFFGPEHESYDELMSADKALHEKISPTPDFVTNMKTRVSDVAAFTATMKAFAKTISKSAEVEVL